MMSCWAENKMDYTHKHIHSFQKQSKIGVKTHKIMKNGKILINICKEKGTNLNILLHGEQSQSQMLSL